MLSESSDTSSNSGHTPTREAGAKITWGPLAAIVITFVVFWVGQFLSGILLSLVPLIADWTAAQADAWFTSTTGQFVFVVLTEIFTVAVLWWFLKRRRAKFSSLGFRRGLRISDVGYALAATVVYFGLLILITAVAGAIFPIDVDQKQETGFDQVVGSGSLIMAFISLVVLPPIVEEILFRGFLYGGLRTKIPAIPATLVTSLLFAAPHLLASSEGLLWIAGVDTFVLSIVLCYLRETTGNVWAAIGLHAIKNGIAFIYLFVAV